MESPINSLPPPVWAIVILQAPPLKRSYPGIREYVRGLMRLRAVCRRWRDFIDTDWVGKLWVTAVGRKAVDVLPPMAPPVNILNTLARQCKIKMDDIIGDPPEFKDSPLIGMCKQGRIAPVRWAIEYCELREDEEEDENILSKMFQWACGAPQHFLAQWLVETFHLTPDKTDIAELVDRLCRRIGKQEGGPGLTTLMWLVSHFGLTPDDIVHSSEAPFETFSEVCRGSDVSMAKWVAKWHKIDPVSWVLWARESRNLRDILEEVEVSTPMIEWLVQWGGSQRKNSSITVP